MAWTTPRTWTDGELVTASMMNTHVRDNLNAGFHLIARKTADQSVTSSTALTNDTDLQLTVGASDVWVLQYRLRWEGDSAADIKATWSFPTSGRLDASFCGLDSTLAVTNAHWAMTVSDATTQALGAGGAGIVRTNLIDGTYIGGGTAGTVIFRWAQLVSSGTATIVKANSTLWAVQLA